MTLKRTPGVRVTHRMQKAEPEISKTQQKEIKPGLPRGKKMVSTKYFLGGMGRQAGERWGLTKETDQQIPHDSIKK